jgi:hypothetical protein
MKHFSLLLLILLVLTACGTSTVEMDMDKADKIVTNQAAPLSLKAKLMASEGSMIRSPASLSISDIEANSDAAYDLMSSISNFKPAGVLTVDEVNYNVGILSVSIGPDLNPEALVLIVNGGSFDSLAFALPTYANSVKKVSLKNREVRVKILQRSETDKSPFYKDSPNCFSIKLGEKIVDQQTFIAKKATFTQGDCKEF